MWAVVPAPLAMCYVVQIEPVFGGAAMEEFLEAIDQLVTADRVRELIRRYDLSQAMATTCQTRASPVSTIWNPRCTGSSSDITSSA
jgi:hypothetical protein